MSDDAGRADDAARAAESERTDGPWSADGSGRNAGDAALDAVSPTDPEPPDPGLARRAFEYVTFGYGPYHLLKAVVLQFVILFLDVRLTDYVQPGFVPGRRGFVTVTWILAVVAFVGVLVVLVRQMGRRTLAPRFHRPSHLAASVCGYVAISGLSFGFGYATLVVPVRGSPALTPAVAFPGTLLSLVFAAFIAIGYHAQVDAIDHPHSEDITHAVVCWFDAISWVEPGTDSLARERAYEEFATRTDELAEVLAHATTIDGRRLQADFRDWRDQFGAHSMLSRETIVRGDAGGGALESTRLDAEHEEFRDLQRRLAVVAGLE